MLHIANFSDLLEKQEHKDIFDDPVKVHELVRVFIRFGAEELMRRVMKNPDKIANNITVVLYPKFKEDFVNVVYKKRMKDTYLLEEP